MKHESLVLDYTVYIPSHRDALAQETKACFNNHPCKIFNGTNYPSFSKLINDCIVDCPTEIIIICSDKVRPTEEQITEMLDLINQGYGITGLYRFGFFGFKKELIRRIGFFDERFIGGNYEDADMIRRLREADISYYENDKVKYTRMPTSWNTSNAQKIFKTKWKETMTTLKRLLDEENYDYNIGESIPCKFLSWENTVLLSGSLSFKDIKVL